MPKISALMPAHNEGHHLYKNILETAATLEKFSPDFEIILIDDGSSDQTFEQALAAQQNLNNQKIKILKNETNLGKGFALKRGFSESSGDYILFLDADLDIHPEQLEKFWQILNNSRADVVTASKRHRDSKINYPLKRKILSDLYYLFTRLIFGLPVRDTQTGFALFKRAVLENVFPKIIVKKYAFSLEVLVVAHYFGYKIVEAPIVIDFKYDFSRINYQDIQKIFMDTLGIFYRLNILKFYDRKK